MPLDAETVWRDFEINGVPSSGAWEPRKSQVRSWGAWIENLYAAAQAGGGLVYATRDDLYADLAHDANQSAWVLEDATSTYNGIYQKSGTSGTGSWSRIGDLPYSFIRASNIGEGTANAIEATTSIPVSGSALILLSIYETNTETPVTVSFNDDAARTIKTNGGDDIDVGALRSGMVVAGLVTATEYRLINDENIATSLLAARDAAVAAKADAEAARDVAAGYASDAVSQGNVPVYATKAGMSAISVPVGINAIRVNGDASAGDGRGGLFVDADNGLPAAFASSDSRSWYPVFYERPIVILSTGQSNAANERAYAWEPVHNVFLWNAEGTTQTGTAFSEMNAAEMNYGFAFANEIAKANPNRAVLMIKAAVPGEPIAAWLPSPPASDVYALSKARVEAALATLPGVDTIDMMLWWQGESDAAAPTGYVDDFEAVVARYRAEAWFPYGTPINIMGVVSAAVNGSSIYRNMNIYLQHVVNGDPEHRAYFYTPGALEVADWLDSLHPTAQGYERAGIAAAKAWTESRPRSSGLVYDPDQGNYGLGRDSLCGVLFDIRQDPDANSRLRVANLDAGANALAEFNILTDDGLFRTQVPSAASSSVFEMYWSGSSPFRFRTIDPTGYYFHIGAGSETARLTATGLNLLSGDIFLNSQKVIGSRRTGWGAPTGTATRTAFATSTVTTAQLAERVKALVDDLTSHGLIGA